MDVVEAANESVPAAAEIEAEGTASSDVLNSASAPAEASAGPPADGDVPSEKPDKPRSIRPEKQPIREVEGSAVEGDRRRCLKCGKTFSARDYKSFRLVVNTGLIVLDHGISDLGLDILDLLAFPKAPPVFPRLSQRLHSTSTQIDTWEKIDSGLQHVANSL